ncbi:MAG: hypothetical protein IJV50_02730 [Lachnospiraceae bacterium]|nr:hypothetical protein [Lachnospiraceae bacterium]
MNELRSTNCDISTFSLQANDVTIDITSKRWYIKNTTDETVMVTTEISKLDAGGNTYADFKQIYHCTAYLHLCGYVSGGI